MPEMMVAVIHVVVDTFEDAARIGRQLEEYRDENKLWCGFRLMRGVDVKVSGKGVYAQTYDFFGKTEDIPSFKHVVEVGVFKGKTMADVGKIIKTNKAEWEKHETKLFHKELVAA